MAGNNLPSLARVKHSDLIPSESLPSDLDKFSVSTLSQFLAQYYAAIIQLCPTDAALWRASLNMLVYTSIKDHHALLWCKTSGYYVDPQLWQETYDFRLGLTPTEPENEIEFSPAGSTDICALLGKAARDILDATSFYLYLRSSPFTEILYNVPLRNREISSVDMLTRKAFVSGSSAP